MIINLLSAFGLFILFICVLWLMVFIIPIFVVTGICVVIFMAIYFAVASRRNNKNKDDPT